MCWKLIYLSAHGANHSKCLDLSSTHSYTQSWSSLFSFPLHFQNWLT